MTVILRGKVIRLVQLQAEMVAAGVAIGVGLQVNGDEVFGSEQTGVQLGFPVYSALQLLPEATAQQVVDIHVPIDPAAVLRTQITALATSSVGVQLNALTPAQVRSLMACLLQLAGGVHADMTVAPLSEWLK